MSTTKASTTERHLAVDSLPSPRRTMILVFYAFLGFYLFLCLFLFVYQKRLVYYPTRGLTLNPRDIGLQYETVTLASGRDNDASIVGWYIPSPRNRATVLFCHGNAGNISDRLESIRMFESLGLNTFIFDYRGYGESRGPLTEQGTYDDVLAAWRYLTDARGEKPERIVLFGRSLGGAIATWLAARVEPAALIVESSFTSIPDMGQTMYPFLPVRLLARYQYDSVKKLRDVRCPTLIIHSPTDDLVPYKHGLRLFEAANEPKEFLEIRGLHNDGFLISDEVYLPGIDAFLEKHLPLADAEGEVPV